jgi:hypothetical protein
MNLTSPNSKSFRQVGREVKLFPTRVGRITSGVGGPRVESESDEEEIEEEEKYSKGDE